MNITAEEVLNRIRHYRDTGVSLNKKKIKKDDPELMRGALYYFPSWEHALREVGIEI